MQLLQFTLKSCCFSLARHTAVASPIPAEHPVISTILAAIAPVIEYAGFPMPREVLHALQISRTLAVSQGLCF